MSSGKEALEVPPVKAQKAREQWPWRPSSWAVSGLLDEIERGEVELQDLDEGPEASLR